MLKTVTMCDNELKQQAVTERWSGPCRMACQETCDSQDLHLGATRDAGRALCKGNSSWKGSGKGESGRAEGMQKTA